MARRLAERAIYIVRILPPFGGVVKVVAGSASVGLARELAKAVAGEFIETSYEKHAGGFPDGERYVRVMGPLQGEAVVVVATTPPPPQNAGILPLMDAVPGLRPPRGHPLVPALRYC